MQTFEILRICFLEILLMQIFQRVILFYLPMIINVNTIERAEFKLLLIVVEMYVQISIDI